MPILNASNLRANDIESVAFLVHLQCLAKAVIRHKTPVFIGARDRNRTGTAFQPRDFKNFVCYQVIPFSPYCHGVLIWHRQILRAICAQPFPCAQDSGEHIAL